MSRLRLDTVETLPGPQRGLASLVADRAPTGLALIANGRVRYANQRMRDLFDGRLDRLPIIVARLASANDGRVSDDLNHDPGWDFAATRWGSAWILSAYRERASSSPGPRAAADSEVIRGIWARDFGLVYQPIVELSSRETLGFEALVRLRTSSGRVIPAARFIAEVESLGLGRSLGEWVAFRALEGRAAWNDPDLGLSVNVSPSHLLGGGLDDLVRELVTDQRIPPDRLMLEVPEEAVIPDPERAGIELVALRELGVSLALARFGVSDESLALTQRYPFDVVKLDRSITRQLACGGAAGELAAHALDGVQRSGLSVIAEGIESDDHVRAVSELGCAIGQGFLLGRPLAMPAHALPRAARREANS